MALQHVEAHPLTDEDAKIEAEIMARWESVKWEKIGADIE